MSISATSVGTVGYLHPDYAASLGEFGRPRALSRSGGTLLIREIPDFPLNDATGCYPLLFCADWLALGADLAELDQVVSVTVVTDPLGAPPPSDLRGAFPDLVRPYKEHFVVDLARPSPSRHHRQMVRQAGRAVAVEPLGDPLAHLDEWARLYAGLATRLGLRGIRAFSREAFRVQLALPGLVAHRAVLDGRTIAIYLWYVMENYAYLHLGASDEEGYRRSASYALVAAALEELDSRGVRWLSLGGAAGALPPSQTDGLVLFKQGWASETRTTHLCGRVVDPASYDRMATRTGRPGNYFPAYRQAEGF